jgi:hypothetical protein
VKAAKTKTPAAKVKIPRFTAKEIADLQAKGEAIRAENIARGKRRSDLAEWLQNDIIAIATDAAWLYGEIMHSTEAHMAVMDRIERTLGGILIDIERNINGAPADADAQAAHDAEVPS